MSTNLTGRQKLAAAILRVADADKGFAPYFGAALRSFVRVEMDAAMVAAMAAHGGRATLAVTANGVLYWSAAFVASSPIDELALGLVHETLHVLLRHFERGKALGVPAHRVRAANLAQDMSINEEIRKLRQPPAWWVYPDTYKQPNNLVWEHRYRLLENEKQPPQPGVGTGWCGGCAGNPVPGEPTAAGKGVQGRSAAELDRVRREVAEAARTHESKRPGTVPGGIVRWADELLQPPKIDWREALSKAFQRAVAYRPGAVDFDWTRMSRRQAGIGYGAGKPVMPAFRAPTPNIGALVDLSGSMSERRVHAAAAELDGLIKAAGAEVLVATVDAELQGLGRCGTFAEAVLLFKGGGGTILTPGFEALARHNPAPEIVVVMTDGEIGDGYPVEEPSYRVIWVVCGGDKQFTPRYGEVVHVDTDDE